MESPLFDVGVHHHYHHCHDDPVCDERGKALTHPVPVPAEDGAGGSETTTSAAVGTGPAAASSLPSPPNLLEEYSLHKTDGGSFEYYRRSTSI